MSAAGKQRTEGRWDQLQTSVTLVPPKPTTQSCARVASACARHASSLDSRRCRFLPDLCSSHTGEGSSAQEDKQDIYSTTLAQQTRAGEERVRLQSQARLYENSRAQCSLRALLLGSGNAVSFPGDLKSRPPQPVTVMSSGVDGGPPGLQLRWVRQA